MERGCVADRRPVRTLTLLRPDQPLACLANVLRLRLCHETAAEPSSGLETVMRNFSRLSGAVSGCTRSQPFFEFSRMVPFDSVSHRLYRSRNVVAGKQCFPRSTHPSLPVWGVGDERARLLGPLKIFSVEDLLLHLLRRYEDRRKIPGDPRIEIEARPRPCAEKSSRASAVKRFRKGARAMFECVLDDGSAMLHCCWWQAQPWMEDFGYAARREFLVFGKTDLLKPRNMDHPETELVEPGDDEFIHTSRIVPIHPLTDGLTAQRDAHAGLARAGKI